MRWYKRYGGDFVQGTLELTLEQKGAFSLLLDLIYNRQKPISDNERWLAGICGVSLRKWRSIRQALIDQDKIYISEGKISNQRADKELENTAKATRKLSESGAKGGRKRAENEAASNKNNELAQARLNHTCAKIRLDKNISPSIPPKMHPGEEPASPDDEDGIIDLEFEKFWRAFPSGRKQGKFKTRHKYHKIISGRDPDFRATTAELLAGAELYASKMAGREARFTKMPCTWLTNGCWLEDNAGAPPDFGKSEEKPKTADDIWFENLQRRLRGKQQAEPAPAGGA